MESINYKDQYIQFHNRVFYPLVIWALGSVFIFYKYLLQVSPGVMQNSLMSVFHMTGASFGNLAAFYFYAYLIMQIPAGSIVDKFRRRLFPTIGISIMLYGVHVFAHANSIKIACLGRGMIGFGAAFAVVSCLKLTSIWFKPKQFATLTGFMMSAAMIGALFGQKPLAILVSHYGWRISLSFIGLIGAVFAFVYFLFVRDHPKGRTRSISYREYSFSLQGFLSILRNPQTWILSLYSGLAFAPISVFGGLWGNGFLENAYHISRVQAAGEVSFAFFGFALGAPFAGWFSDKIGRRKIVMLVGTILAFIFLTVVIYCDIPYMWVLSLSFFMFGFGSSFFLLCFTMVREISLITMTATAIGFMNTFDALCGAFSEPMVGKLLDLNWHGTMSHGARIFSVGDYKVALSALLLYLFISIVLLFFTKETYCRQHSLN